MINKKTVSEVVNEIKIMLEREFRNIVIEGEITNLSLSSSGHYYFTLSDSESSMSSAMFRMDAVRNPVIRQLKNGDKVICSGNVGVYSKRGTFQLIAKNIVPVGKGDLKEQFELLKRKLSSKGLFDIDIKKEIPKYPKRIAVITAKQGAALQDFLNIYKRRSIWMDILVVPALVQGNTAPRSIANALRAVEEFSDRQEEGRKIDVIVITRGGGSLEDLWAFNSEGLAREIVNCQIPTISAVGHQVDYSISDFVADLRCETPSAAAEVLTMEQMKIQKNMDYISKSLIANSKIMLGDSSKKLESYHPKEILEYIQKLYINYISRVEACNISGRLFELTNMHEKYMMLDEFQGRLSSAVDKVTNNAHHRIDNLNDMLKALNPENVLDRGYSYIKAKNNKIINNLEMFNELASGDEITVKFSDGVGDVLKK